MNKALDEQLKMAERHEEIRKQAEERHKKIAAYRDAMMSMTMEERRAYMDEHADEIFGSPGEFKRPEAPPRPSRAMRPPSPPAMEGHADEMFGSPGDMRRPEPPQRPSWAMQGRRGPMDEQADEMFGSPADMRRPEAPQRPPWAMRRPPHPAYGPGPRGPRPPWASPAPESTQEAQSGS